MSTDIRIWFEKPLDPLRRDVCIDGGDWQITSDYVDDVPENFAPPLLEARSGRPAAMLELHLEPGDAPRVAYEALQRVALTLANQGGRLERESDVPANEEETGSFLTLSWWFLKDLGRKPELERLIAVLSARLPEALPERYGLWEPPNQHLEKEGKSHLISSLEEHLIESPIVVWWPRSPVDDFDLCLQRPAGWTRRGFKTSYCSLSVRVPEGEGRDWNSKLQPLWNELALLFEPVYADAREYRSGSGSLRFQHPICGPWFSGVPVEHPQAMALGPEYRDWAKAWEAGREDHGLLFLGTLIDPPGELAGRLGPVPQEFAQRDSGYAVGGWGPNWRRRYPPFMPVARPGHLK